MCQIVTIHLVVESASIYAYRELRNKLMMLEGMKMQSVVKWNFFLLLKWFKYNAKSHIEVVP